MLKQHSRNSSRMSSQANLKKLQKEWYKKLQEEGFIDIETHSHKDTPLTTWHSLKWKNLSLEVMETTLEYNSMARDLLNTHDFQTETHKRIWELHCDGLSKRKIEKILQTTENPYKREAIGLIIKNIASLIK